MQVQATSYQDMSFIWGDHREFSKEGSETGMPTTSSAIDGKEGWAREVRLDVVYSCSSMDNPRTNLGESCPVRAHDMTFW